MVFADRLPDKWTSYDARIVFWHLPIPVRSDRFAITPRYPRKPNALAAERRFRYTTVAIGRWYASPRESIAQIIRAFLCAKAVAATGIGRRIRSGVSQGRGRRFGRLIAPTTALAP